MVQISLEQMPTALSLLHAKVDELSGLVRQLLERGHSDADEILNVQQAAKLVHLAVPTIYKMIEQRQIPHSKPNGRVYFSKADLIEWAKSERRKTNAEIEAEASQYTSRKKGGVKW